MLDWLAVEFREGGWDQKKLVKLLVTSAAFRQELLPKPVRRYAGRERMLGGDEPLRPVEPRGPARRIPLQRRHLLSALLNSREFAYNH